MSAQVTNLSPPSISTCRQHDDGWESYELLLVIASSVGDIMFLLERRRGGEPESLFSNCLFWEVQVNNQDS